MQALARLSRAGAAGAAAGTATAQTLALLPLLLALQRKLQAERTAAPPSTGAAAAEPSAASIRELPLVGLFAPPGGLPAFVASVRGYLGAGGFVLLRALGKISAYSVCAREAARLGAVASAAHNLCFQLGVATTQLCESIGIATQTLLAREMGQHADADGGAVETADAREAPAAAEEQARRMLAVRHILSRAFGIGLAIAGALSLVTFVNRRAVIAGLTTIPDVRAAVSPCLHSLSSCDSLLQNGRCCRCARLPTVSCPSCCSVRLSKGWPTL